MIETALKVTGIDHTVLYVSDLKRSRAFYVDFLGMTVAHEGDSNAFLRCGKEEVILFQTRHGQAASGGKEINHMALRLESGEYEEVKAAVEQAGFKVSGRPGDDHCIYFNDPDGHRLQLLTPKEQG